MTIPTVSSPTNIQSTLITDPTLQDCLHLASKIRALCHQILSTLHLATIADNPTTPDDNNPSILLTDEDEAEPTNSTTATPLLTHLSTSQKTTLSSQQKLLSSYLVQLKILHRTAYMSIRESKLVTNEKRSEVDRLHLQLQNLYYEQRHLRGEINSAREFPHKYTSLPLTPLSEFLLSHPEYTDNSKSDHEIMIARLHDEKAVRDQLEKRRRELLLRKQNLILENKKRKEELAGLDEMLKKFIESSRSIQRTFEKEY